MNRSYLARVLPAIAFVLVLPAWAVAPSEQAKHNTDTAVSDQTHQSSNTSDPSAQSDSAKAEGKAGAGKQKPHGPTATMDRATPTEKSDKGDASAKHPPTVRMDHSTPDQKSPASAAGNSDTAK
jgi:hypothetical protein